MVYLFIIFLVAATGITRLWLQQRREQSQMDTIEGFNSALQAMSPPARASRKRATRGIRATRRATRVVRRRMPRRPVIKGWFVTRHAGSRTASRIPEFRYSARRDATVTKFKDRRSPSRYERYAG